MTDSPPWTDHNTHDPGITILEALAYSVAALLGTAVVVRMVRRRRRRHPV
jgi:hypothetical protein